MISSISSPLGYQSHLLQRNTNITNTKRPYLESENSGNIENLPTKLFKGAVSAGKENRPVKININKKKPLKKYHDRVDKICQTHGVTRTEYTEFMRDFKIKKTTEPFKISFAMLHKAVTDGNDRMLKIFKELGADLNEIDSNGHTCVTTAIDEGNEEILKLLAELGADLDHTSHDGNFPLLEAIDDNDNEKVRLLLKLKADPNRISIDKETSPLIQAVRLGSEKAIKQLIRAGANPNLSSTLNNTPLVKAVNYKNLSLMELLINLRADVNHFSGKGCSPLTKASKNGHPEIIRFLLRSGADINLPDGSGEPPLSHAAQRHHHESVAILEHFGADRTVASEIIARIALGNIWGLKNISAFTWLDPESQNTYTYSIALEGCLCKHVKVLFKKYINRFFESINDNTRLISKEIEGLITQSINTSFDSSKAAPEEVLSLIDAGIPYVILGGSIEHAVSIIIYNDALTVFNRGDGARHFAANSYYLPFSQITPSLISDLRKDHVNMDEFNEMIDSLNLEPIGGFTQEDSKVGNCPWASSKGALKVILLELIEDEKTANKVYKQFTNFVREQSLDDYFRVSTQNGYELIEQIRDKLSKKPGLLKAKALLEARKMWPPEE